MKELETALSQANEENLSLKKDMEDHEESWKTHLELAESKLAETKATLKSLTDILNELVKAIWGKLLIPLSFLIIVLSLNCAFSEFSTLFLISYRNPESSNT